MKKNKLFGIILAGIFVITLEIIFVVVCLVKIMSPSSSLEPNQIFNKNIHCVVEVKASNEGVGTSFGTAEFIDNNGRLVTNAHVVTYTKTGQVFVFEELLIRFADEDEYRDVKLIKYDEDIDLALLQVEDLSCGFQAIETGDSTKLKSGDIVYAIGNTMNYGLSISKGIVGIPLIKIDYADKLREVIQCDLTIAEGNSGGALVDEKGRLMGLTTFRLKDSFGNVVYGIAYCIPINTVIEFVKS